MSFADLDSNNGFALAINEVQNRNTLGVPEYLGPDQKRDYARRAYFVKFAETTGGEVGRMRDLLIDFTGGDLPVKIGRGRKPYSQFNEDEIRNTFKQTLRHNREILQTYRQVRQPITLTQ